MSFPRWKKYMCYVAYSGEICYAANLLRRRGDEEDKPSPVLIVLNDAANVGSFQCSNSWWLRHPRCRLPWTRQQARCRLSSKPFCRLIQLQIPQNSLTQSNQMNWFMSTARG